ncbi:MAG: hypothetical protein AN487_06120 [Anabaena sp. CRKS33]|jgi:hypothetical protein|nr:MAG: hypothetical protein AN487_06120 [Anabaena sp. CRKS33]
MRSLILFFDILNKNKKSNQCDTYGEQKVYSFKETRLLKIVEENVIPNSLIRNKVAHGQWVVALNREHTAKNENLTN